MTITLADIEAAHAEALARAKNTHEVASLAIAAIGRQLVTEHAAIESRLAALESKRTMSFSGSHDPGRAYAPGEAVQRGGSLWVAMAPTKVGDIPGAHTCWREIGRCK
jgi:hypothetical protein